MQALILASESPYRAELLARLGLAFDTVSPAIDESRHAAESLSSMANRLAAEKASAVRKRLASSDSEHPAAGDDTAHPAESATLIIASDQVAALNNQPLGKPLTMENARHQLSSMSGQTIEFLTALTILHLHSGESYKALDVTRVTLRELDEMSIERYLNAEKPLNCAGSFKVEALGISLFESVCSDDPTALIGLPLIAVCKGLRHFGWSVP